MWESGIIAGITGFAIMVLNLVIVGTANIHIEGQHTLPYVLLLAMDVLAFIAAGLFAGVLASRYDAGGKRSFLSGVIAGCFVAYIPASVLVLFAAKDAYALLTDYPVSWSDVPVGLIILFTLIVQVAMTGLIAWVYARHFGLGKKRKAEAVAGEDGDLIELKAAYDDLWKDARTLASDLNNSVQMYLMVGAFALIFGFVLATYALASWQRINAGSTDLADAAAAIGETVGCAMLLVAGPLLIRWYFKLKARYARLMCIEQETGE
jgi:hypothetical protein